LAFQMKCDILFNVLYILYSQMVALTFLALVPFQLEVFITLEHNMWYIAYIYRRNSLPLSQWAKASIFTRFLDITQRRITVGRTPLDE
jgi:hypothetical protein